LCLFPSEEEKETKVILLFYTADHSEGKPSDSFDAREEEKGRVKILLRSSVGGKKDCGIVLPITMGGGEEGKRIELSDTPLVNNGSFPAQKEKGR